MPNIIVPNVESEDFKKFVSKLDKAISNSELQKLPLYPSGNFTVKAVTVLPSVATYPEGQCWFNSYIYANKKGWNPIFGWFIFEDEGKKYIAQNHAVVQDKMGNLIDPTSCSYISDQNEKGVFIPDLRAMIQLDHLRAPGTFECKINDANGEWRNHEGQSNSLLYNKFPSSPGLKRFITEQVKAKRHQHELYQV
ncbi:TPA: hypothetical protein I7264_03285 [Vibrio parahaemolyticus]|nr:hypothetical protein [Vibrio parahaemolyticus]HAS6394539.1 hypothetical protein [Vibrio vulnificus]MDG2604263.1 hypothetical protein [Vibrio parahaemolyticus]HAS6610689.1 hypothetical protein [Vibrio parahaemolyticus]HAS6621301.1 hypothetical protein [Vibrio parahaemolyticus]